MIYKNVVKTIPAVLMMAGTTLMITPQSILAASSHQGASYVQEDKVTAELRDLRRLMGDLRRDSDRLHLLQRSSTNWQTHAAHLGEVKERVNRLGEQFRQLESMRMAATPWQQDAIDKTLPLAVEVAASTNAALHHLNGNQYRLRDPQYVEHLQTISELSETMHGIVDTHLEIVEAQDRIEKLEGKLAETAEL